MGNLFAVGDIHGCIDPLEELLESLPLDYNNDVLVFLGDYIDRGPHSKEVVDLVLELKSKIKDVHCLMGNHEMMFLDYLNDKDSNSLFLANGGYDTLESYRANNLTMIPEEHLKFYYSLEWIFESDDYIFVHAGLRPGVELEKQSHRDMIWIRHEFISAANNFGKTVIFGHTPFAQPFVSDDKIGIDTGCVFGNKLTALQLPQMNFYSV